MKPADRNLGMDRSISRRDLLLGMGAAAASAFIPGRAFADEMLRLERTGGVGPGYPPGLTGLRGNHVGSFEVSHQLVNLRQLFLLQSVKTVFQGVCFLFSSLDLFVDITNR